MADLHFDKDTGPVDHVNFPEWADHVLLQSMPGFVAVENLSNIKMLMKLF